MNNNSVRPTVLLQTFPLRASTCSERTTPWFAGRRSTWCSCRAHSPFVVCAGFWRATSPGGSCSSRWGGRSSWLSCRRWWPAHNRIGLWSWAFHRSPHLHRLHRCFHGLGNHFRFFVKKLVMVLSVKTWSCCQLFLFIWKVCFTMSRDVLEKKSLGGRDFFQRPPMKFSFGWAPINYFIRKINVFY